MSLKKAIIVTGPDLAPQAVSLLADFDIFYTSKAPSEDDLVDLCRKHDPVALIVRFGKVGAAVMDAAPSLRVISKSGSGTDTIDKVAAQDRGIEVRASIGINAPAVAEHTMALLLACTKSIIHLDARMRAGHWDKSTHKSVELQGRTIGLIGLGAIGRRFARICDAMSMKVIGFDPRASGLPDYISKVDLEAIWRESDVISLHCPLTEENRNMINAHVLGRCKKGVFLVNTARGGLVDEAALLDALHSGQVAGAGLDSFAVEPMPAQHPFYSEPRVTLSPHIGGVTTDAYVNMGLGAARNLLEALQ